MKILSNFHDYYDSVMSLDQDRSIVYNRKKEHVWSEIDFFNEEKRCHHYQYLKPHDKKRYKYWLNRNYAVADDGRATTYLEQMTKHKICFCGKVYTVIESNGVYCYNIEELDGRVAQFGKKEVEKFNEKNEYSWRTRANCRKELAYNGEESVAIEYMQHLPLPIVSTINEDHVWQDTNVCLHPFLKGFQFYKVRDINSAYQELSQFMSNVAFPNKPIPDVSDRDMIVAKGFDLKTSFRKEKQK